MIQGFLDGCRDEYKAGNKWALLQAIQACGIENVYLPKWVVEEFSNSLELVRVGKARSWDEVFGPAHPKGTHLNATHKKQTYLWPVYNRINELLASTPGPAIDESLFEAVGKEFNLGKTLTSEYYYEAKNRLKKLDLGQ